MAKVKTKISNGLVALSSAAILAVYAAGYELTDSAADRFKAHEQEYRPPAFAVRKVVPSAAAPLPIEAPAPAALLPSVEPPLPPARIPVQDEIPETTAPAETAETVAADDLPAWKDGRYLGWGYSRHGDIQAFITIQDGQIVSAGIEKCWTRYTCGIIDHLPPQVVSRQSPTVDFVSGATESVDAFHDGIVEALKQAQ